MFICRLDVVRELDRKNKVVRLEVRRPTPQLKPVSSDSPPNTADPSGNLPPHTSIQSPECTPAPDSNPDSQWPGSSASQCRAMKKSFRSQSPPPARPQTADPRR